MKIQFISILLTLCSGIISAQNLVTLEFSGVEKNGGTVYVSLFNSEKSFKEKQVYLKLEFEPKAEILQQEISLPDGEYFFSAYQDHNRNRKLDANLIGIPKEKFAFSNYDAKSPPGGFSRHKVSIAQPVTRVKLQFYKL
jgi:uncharacterized protein (DUF2141 family)